MTATGKGRPRAGSEEEDVIASGGSFCTPIKRAASQPGSPFESPSPRIPSGGPRSLSGLLADAVVTRATEFLPAGLSGSLTTLGSSLSRRVRSPAAAPAPLPPPTTQVPVRRLDGSEVALRLPLDASLAQLQQECWEAAGVPAPLQRLVIEERRGEPGLVNLLRSTAGHLTNRERLARTMVQWVNYLFLPESVNTEIKGAGIISWASDNVWAHLARQPPGRVGVSVLLLSERRYSLQLPLGTPLRRLQEVVERQAGLPPERQALRVEEQRQASWAERALWGVLRALLACWRLALGALGAALAGADTDLRVQVQSEDGREATVRLRGDMTLQQLQALVEQEQGEEFKVHRVLLPPSPSK